MRVPEPTPHFKYNQYNFKTILDELIEMGKFDDFIEITNTKYYYWDKWKYLAKQWEYDAAKLWYAVKTRRSGNNLVWGSKLDRLQFRISTPSVIQEYLHRFDMHLGGFLQGDSIIPAAEKDHYLIGSLMEEAIASSQLEGAATTRRMAKDMLEKARKPKNSSEQMILNNFLAMKWIVENKDQPISVPNLKHLHRILTHSTLSREEEGNFRQDDEVKVVDNQTGRVLHQPPPYNQLEQLMDDFCAFANDEKRQSFFIHPITKAIILHFLIGYIHPFADGNGRTARTVFYWYLIKKGYWLIEYMSVSRIILKSKTKYARAYLHTEADENDLTYFILYNLRALNIALEELKSYINRKNQEKQRAMSLLRNTQFNDRQILLIQELLHDTAAYFTVTQVQTKFGISNQTARNDLGDLVEQGVLESRKSGKKIQFLGAKDFSKKLGLR